jgi:hypothetical protein
MLYVDHDTLIINGKRIDQSVILAITEPGKRALWAFIEKDGVVQAVPYDENQVIWLDRRE